MISAYVLPLIPVKDDASILAVGVLLPALSNAGGGECGDFECTRVPWYS